MAKLIQEMFTMENMILDIKSNLKICNESIYSNYNLLSLRENSIINDVKEIETSEYLFKISSNGDKELQIKCLKKILKNNMR